MPWPGPNLNADLEGWVKCCTVAGKRSWAGMEWRGADTRLLLQQSVHMCRMFS